MFIMGLNGSHMSANGDKVDTKNWWGPWVITLDPHWVQIGSHS